MRPPGSLERRDGEDVCRTEFPGLQSSDFKSFATLEEVGWPNNCLTLGAVIVNFLTLELAWPINAPSLFSISAPTSLSAYQQGNTSN